MRPGLRQILLGGPSPYLGQVGTRCILPNARSITFKYANSARAHYIRDDIVSIRPLFPNFYINQGNGEAGSGGSATISASIEYPLGTRTQFTWSGSSSGTVADNSYGGPDALAISIPQGSLIYIHEHWENATAFLYTAYSGTHPGVFLSDKYEYSATSLADKTMSGTITNTNANNTNTFGCCALIAQTKKGSVYIIGDSRGQGTQDDVGTTGDLGEIAKAIGPTFAHMNHATNSGAVSGFNTAHTNQLLLSQYCSHIVIQAGINDVYAGASASTLATRRQTALALFSGKKVFETTLGPETTSTDSWATTGNQSQVSSANNTQRVAFNALVRAGSAGFAGYFDIADAVESARDSGLWTPNYTPDGVHENATANTAISTAGTIPLSSFRR